MSTVALRRKIKKTIDRLPPKRLESLADYVRFLDQAAILQSVLAGEKAIRVGRA